MIKKLSILIFLSSAALAVAATPQQTQGRERASVETLRARMPTVFSDFQIISNVVYKTVGDRGMQLDLLIPKNLAKKPAPLLFHIHGGGWVAGSRYGIQTAARQFFRHRNPGEMHNAASDSDGAQRLETGRADILHWYQAHGETLDARYRAAAPRP